MTTDKETKIAKSLFNYQRTRILQVIKDKEKTVKEIATLLNEKPSKLYYHVNQLEELGLIKVVDEKKVNNLTQKYYLAEAAASMLGEYTFSHENANQNSEYILFQLKAFSDVAISRIESDLLDKTDEIVSSEASIVSVQLTREEWREVNEKIRDIVSRKKKHSEKDEIYNVNYIIMSYLDQ
ncbi:winged helix-turn-helix domain-containing protein [Virgibacillus dokdonensis]|uniref:winged helix-turn-helix domain-containing protein n=1 Tax=Virgibacillus dokdonensis TaxID=302167 RepID=UPI00098B2FEF|nr:winged helix-turn-helix domain-containing protein [Virgibacillus dokdonensis]